MMEKSATFWSRTTRFLRTTVLGGVGVLLPILLSFLLLRWLFRTGVDLVHPITRALIDAVALQEIVAQVLAVVMVISVCFLTGLVIRTRLGGWILSSLERHILRVAPGYSLFKETLRQLLGSGKRPFTSVVLGKVFCGETLMTGFITDENPGCDRVTVFFPSALNPTTGLLCHLREQDIRRLDVSVETAMRTIISCGVGSSTLLRSMDAGIRGTTEDTAAEE